MAVAYNSRDIVEDYLHYKLLNNGVRWRFAPAPRPAGGQQDHNRATSASSWTNRNMAPSRLQVVLRCAGDELECRYRGDLSAQVSALLLSEGSRAERRRGLTMVREELFRDGVNWGRIVALMELGGALCIEVVKKDGVCHVDDIAGWMEESLDSPPLQGWIEDNGGWDAFVELYSESRPSIGFWSLRTVLGLAVLGAAGIMLGVLFTQK